jgi:uncharacterized protein
MRESASLLAQSKSVSRRVVNFLLYLFIAYVLLLVLIRIFEHKLVFFPDYPGRLEGDWHPSELPLLEDVYFAAPDGTKLHAWWIPNSQAKFTFLAFHGNASNVANRALTYEFLGTIPVNVFAVEYRGYGHSDGTPSESGIYQDAEGAYRYLITTKGIDPKTIISYGQSLGTTVASYLAMQHQVAGVVLEAPFPSASVVAKHFYPFLPGVSFLVYGQFATQERLRKISVPLFVVHCTQDPVIPYELGQQVFSTTNSPKTFLRIDGSCHEEASAISPTQYHAALREFLSSLNPTSSAS